MSHHYTKMTAIDKLVELLDAKAYSQGLLVRLHIVPLRCRHCSRAKGYWHLIAIIFNMTQHCPKSIW